MICSPAGILVSSTCPLASVIPVMCVFLTETVAPATGCLCCSFLIVALKLLCADALGPADKEAISTKIYNMTCVPFENEPMTQRSPIRQLGEQEGMLNQVAIYAVLNTKRGQACERWVGGGVPASLRGETKTIAVVIDSWQ